MVQRLSRVWLGLLFHIRAFRFLAEYAFGDDLQPSTWNVALAVRASAFNNPLNWTDGRTTGKNEMEMKFCQSCGMPLNNDNKGTEADGSISEEYIF